MKRDILYVALAACLLAVCLATVGCQFTRDGQRLSWGDMTVQEQLEIAEFGLSVAREAYWLYMDHQEAKPDDDQAQSLEERVLYYANLVAQLREALDARPQVE